MFKSVFFIAMTVMLSAVSPAFSAAIDNKQTIKVTRSGTHDMLGVLVADDKEDTESRVKVFAVIENSPAEKAGIKKEDLLLEIDGRELKNARALSLDAEKWRENDVLTIKLRRKKKTMTVKATITTLENPRAMFVFTGKDKGEMEDSDVEAFFFRDDDGRMEGDEEDGQIKIIMDTDEEADMDEVSSFTYGQKGAYLGVEAKTLSRQLAGYFGVENGVLIETVIKDSPAQKAGLKAGDVITSVNKRMVADHGDLIRTLNYYNPGETVPVQIMRKGDRKNLQVTLGDKPARFSWSGKGETFDADGFRQLRMHIPSLRKNMQKLRMELRKLKGTPLREFFLI